MSVCSTDGQKGVNACGHGKLFAGVSVTVRFSLFWYVYHGFGCLIKEGVLVFRITVVVCFSFILC